MAKPKKNQDLEELDDLFESETTEDDDYDEETEEAQTGAVKNEAPVLAVPDSLDKSVDAAADEAPDDTTPDENQEEEKTPVRMSLAEQLEQGRPTDRHAKWYVVHTYSGHENKVKVNIEKIVENRGMQDLVVNIIVPTEETVEIKNGQKKMKTRKMFPGYVLVKMVVTNESWYLVRNTQGVTGFVGHGSEPIPLTNEEVRRMGIEKVYVKMDIESGDSVKVINGPFESFIGTVEEVNMDKQIMKVRISMFGRDTPVELEFGQVDKL